MVIIFLIGIIFFLLIFLLSMIWPPDSPWSPWWRTSNHVAKVMCDLAKVTKNDVIYDLGSGEGTALILAAKQYGAKGVGIEIDPFRVFTSRIAAKVSGVADRISIRRNNFFAVDTSPATVVFMYLIPKTLNRLKPKLLQELQPGARIVTFVYTMDLPLIAQDEKTEVYVYEIPKKKK